jgi:hypothetical protein
VPSPVPLRDRVHPLLSLTSPSEYVLLVTCPTPQRRAPSLGSYFPFATEASGVHSTPGFPHPTTFRPQRFSHSRRFAPPHTARACFIPLPRLGFALQGFSPLPSRLASSTSRALMSLPSFSSRRVASPLPVPLASPPGLCSEQRSVAADRRFRPAFRSIPSWAFTPAGFPPAALVTPSRPLRS